MKYPRYMFYLIERKARFLHRYAWIKGDVSRDGRVPLPLVYKLYLTLRCNLKCSMCMFWGDSGVCYGKEDFPQGDLEFKVIERIFKEGVRHHPSFILSGGEPLLYPRFAELAALLKRHKCFAYVCTNGTEIERWIDIIKDNPYLIFYVSLDGPQEINDALRGKGVYEKVTRNIRLLKGLPQSKYVGLQYTLQPENVKVLYETCKQAVSLGVDWILINLQWYVTPEQAREYEESLKRNFKVTPHSHLGFMRPFNLDKEEFVRQCAKIRAEKWPIQISSYLKEPQDIYPYIDEPRKNPYNSFCYKQWLRMDILPNGDVTPCIQYPDLVFGNLKQGSLEQIWNSPAYEKFRKFIRKELFSVCGKCYCLFLYDKNRIKL